MASGPLDSVLALRPPAFALLHRPESTGAMLEVLIGEVSNPAALGELPLPEDAGETDGPCHDVLAIVPYRHLAERGFTCVDDGSPLIAMTVTQQETVPLARALERIPDVATRLKGERFDLDDETYAEMVRGVVRDEIGNGEGSNFVLKRSFTAEITDYSLHTALAFFRRLVQRESGAYWTFLVHTGDRTFVGATPERHISLAEGTAVMNPVSGTYRYPPSGPSLPEVLDFLADRKETDELYMVVDEELKMMTRICDTDVKVLGPYLKEMARLAHTGYFIEGSSERDPREILRETLFAPTVTGSPLENACRVIKKYEPEGRGYYSGVIALMGRDGCGRRSLDSGILIRTADIDSAGRVRIGVGATLVRHSAPESEVAETWAKVAGLRSALSTGGSASLSTHPRVRAALEQRNATVSGFWRAEGCGAVAPWSDRSLPGRRVLVVDAEDTFTSMLEHQLRSLGLSVDLQRYDGPYTFGGHDLVVLGPGPGDPGDRGHPKIAHLRSAVRTLLAERRPFLAVCLSHQVLSLELGLAVARREVPNQGVQRRIDLFGATEDVGFYNSFAANSRAAEFNRDDLGTVRVSRDPETGEVHALLGPGFASLQFHAESLLTRNGVSIVGRLLTTLLRGETVPPWPAQEESAAGPSVRSARAPFEVHTVLR